MAQLTFIETDGVHIATATVNADFNIHLESVQGVNIYIGATTLSGGKEIELFNGRGFGKNGDMFDKSYHDVVFPKYLTIKLDAAPITNKCVIKEAE
jgi:hypothetical protein